MFNQLMMIKKYSLTVDKLDPRMNLIVMNYWRKKINQGLLMMLLMIT